MVFTANDFNIFSKQKKPQTDKNKQTRNARKGYRIWKLSPDTEIKDIHG